MSTVWGAFLTQLSGMLIYAAPHAALFLAGCIATASLFGVKDTHAKLQLIGWIVLFLDTIIGTPIQAYVVAIVVSTHEYSSSIQIVSIMNMIIELVGFILIIASLFFIKRSQPSPEFTGNGNASTPVLQRGPVVPHRSGAVLTLGIISVFIIPALGMTAWAMGHDDLRAMSDGWMDPSGRARTNAGKVMGIIGTMIFCFWIIVFLIFMPYLLMQAASLHVR